MRSWPHSAFDVRRFADFLDLVKSGTHQLSRDRHPPNIFLLAPFFSASVFAGIWEIIGDSGKTGRKMPKLLIPGQSADCPPVGSHGYSFDGTGLPDRLPLQSNQATPHSVLTYSRNRGWNAWASITNERPVSLRL